MLILPFHAAKASTFIHSLKGADYQPVISKMHSVLQASSFPRISKLCPLTVCINTQPHPSFRVNWHDYVYVCVWGGGGMGWGGVDTSDDEKQGD